MSFKPLNYGEWKSINLPPILNSSQVLNINMCCLPEVRVQSKRCLPVSRLDEGFTWSQKQEDAFTPPVSAPSPQRVS